MTPVRSRGGWPTGSRGDSIRVCAVIVRCSRRGGLLSKLLSRPLCGTCDLLHLQSIDWSGWAGSNRRPPVPKTGALPLRYTPLRQDILMIRAAARADKVTGPWARKRARARADAPPHLNPLPQGALHLKAPAAGDIGSSR